MKKARDHNDYLDDILDASTKAAQFVEGMDFNSFAADDKTVYAVVRALEIIGEATKRVPEDVRRNHQDVPW